MPKKKTSDNKAISIGSAALAEIKAELENLTTMEPGAKSVREAIKELMPLIRGCRARGHSWNRIAASFQKQVNGVSASLLSKYAYELDPNLKGEAKGAATRKQEKGAPVATAPPTILTAAPPPPPGFMEAVEAARATAKTGTAPAAAPKTSIIRDKT